MILYFKEIKVYEMKIYGENNNIFDAVESFIEYGIVAIKGTKTPALNYAHRIIKALEPYSNVTPTVSYQNVEHNGYLYFIVDLNRFDLLDNEIKEFINIIDKTNIG